MYNNILYVFGYWADPVLHLLLLKTKELHVTSLDLKTVHSGLVNFEVRKMSK